MQARLAPARISNFAACLAHFKLGHHVSVSTCRRFLGLMAAASPVLPLGLLHMRPILLLDESAEDTPHGTSYSPNQCVAQLLSCPLKMARPHFSPEWSRNGCDSPSPYDYDGRTDDRLGRSLRGQTGVRGMDRTVPFLAHKLPGAQSRLPGFDSFSPRSWEASCNSQDGQHGDSVPHKLSGGVHSRAPWTGFWSQDEFLSLRAVHVPGILNLADDFLSRQKLRPGEWMLNRQTVAQI